MNKTIKFGFGFILITFLLVLLLLMLPRFANSWDIINDSTCSPPCLRNIIPGVTTQTEALNIVTANKVFGACDLLDQTNQGGIKYIHCKSYKRSINITLDDNRVAGIGIHPYPSYNLKSITERFGDPKWVSCGLVNLPDYPNRAQPILWFDNYSTSVFLPEIDADQCTLSSSLAIETIVYNSIDDYQEKKSAAERLNDFMLWEGYKKYPGQDLP